MIQASGFRVQGRGFGVWNLGFEGSSSCSFGKKGFLMLGGLKASKKCLLVGEALFPKP